MTEISLYIQDYFSDEIDQLRSLHYSDQGVSSSSTKDQLDNSSRHILAFSDENLIGAIRLTIDSSDVNHEKSANLTKAVVVSSWRRRELYKLLMLEIVMLSFEMGCSKAIAKVPLSIVFKKFLISLGFEIVGEPTVFDDPPFQTIICENIQLNLRDNYLKIIHARNDLLLRFQAKNFHITSHY